jgi:hypothetical protein
MTEQTTVKTGEAFLRQLQEEAEWSGFHRSLKAWVHDHSEVARVLHEMDARTTAAVRSTSETRPAVEHVMVYRCTLNDDSPYADMVAPRCGWSTTDYAEIDAHEDQVEPGHSVIGSVEAVPVNGKPRDRRAFDPNATADEDDRPCLMCLEEDCHGGCLS